MTQTRDAVISLVRLYFLIHVLLACLADFYLLHFYGSKSTISWLLRDWFDQWGILPYLFAFFMGILFNHLLGH